MLRGEGVSQPDIDVKPLVLEFDSVRVTRSVKRSLTIANLGANILNVDSLVFSNPDFSTETNAFALACTKDSVITVTFSPTLVRAYNDTLWIWSNDPNENPVVVLLRGVGKPAPQAIIVVKPLELDFGVACADSVLFVEVSNAGDTTLHVTDLNFSNPAFSTTHDTSFAVGPGANVTIPVLYTATEGQTDTGTLSILSAEQPTVVVTLKGQGGAPDIAGATEAIFDTVEVQVCAGISNADTLVYTINNEGACALRIDSLRVGGPFAVISPATPQTIPAGGSLVVTLSFTPQANGSFVDTLRVFSNDPDAGKNPFKVVLRGEGISQPDIDAKPDTLDFGSVQVTLSKELPLTITNFGASLLTVDNLTVSHPDFGVDTGEFSLACNEDSVITVAFSPKTIGAYLDTLWIWSNDPDENPLVVILRANGTPPPQPDIEVSPSVIPFGTLCAVDSQAVEVRNIGAGSLHVTNLVFTNPVAFSTTHARDFVVAPGDTETVMVVFKPTFAKPDAGSLLIYSNDPVDSVVVVNLQGSGGTPDIAGGSEALFDSVEVQTCSGSEKSETTIYTLRNLGNCTLTLKSLSVRPPFRVVPPISFEITPGGSLDVPLVFTPLTSGMFADTLFITSDDPDEKIFKVVLRGKGVFHPDIDVTPLALDFGKVLVGESDSLFITIASKGAKDLIVSGLVFSKPADFRSPTAPPFTLPCSTDSVITIIFTPSIEGLVNETLSIFSNDPNENPVVVQLRGEGDARTPIVDLQPKPLQFPDVCLGADATLCLTVTNSGTLDLVVSNWYIIPPDGIFASEVKEFELGVGQQNNENICVTFSPKDTVEYRGYLVIESNAPSSPDTVLLIGRGLSPHIAGADSLFFPPTGVGDTSTVLYTVFNKTTCDLRLDSLAISGADSSDFSVVGMTIPPDTTIASNDSLKISVRFIPTALGLRTSQMKIWSNDRKTNPFVVQLQGNGLPGALTVIPNPLEAKAACVGETKIIIGRLENNGPGILVLYPPLQLASEVNSNDQYRPFKLIAPILRQDSLVLAAGQAVEIKIEFTANDTGTYTDELWVRLGTPNAAPTSVPVVGNAREKGARISVVPDVLSFVGRWNKDAVQSVSIKNIGCEPLTIQKVEVILGQNNFVLETDPSVVTLQPDVSVDATVSFRGRIFDKVYTGELVVYSTDSENNSPEHVMLTGRLESGDNICLTLPDTLNFGEVAVGKEPSLPLKIENCDVQDETFLVIKARELKNEKKAFIVSLDGEVELVPTEKNSFNVNFKPNASRVFLDSLLLDVWIKDKPETRITEKVVLIGTGTGVDEVTLRPNVVTPNGDEKNDWAVFTFPEDLQNPVVRIFDMRGLRVILLQDDDGNNTIKWDGKDDKRQYVLPGPYLWIFEAEGRKVKSGQIVVIR